MDKQAELNAAQKKAKGLQDAMYLMDQDSDLLIKLQTEVAVSINKAIYTLVKEHMRKVLDALTEARADHQEVALEMAKRYYEAAAEVSMLEDEIEA